MEQSPRQRELCMQRLYGTKKQGPFEKQKIFNGTRGQRGIESKVGNAAGEISRDKSSWVLEEVLVSTMKAMKSHLTVFK